MKKTVFKSSVVFLFLASILIMPKPVQAAGALDPGFGTDGKVITDSGSILDQANALVIQPDDKLVVAGFSRKALSDDFALARYNSDGTLDTSFGTDGIVVTDLSPTLDPAYDLANALVLQSDAKLVAAGVSNGRFALVRYNPDGSLDTTFGNDGKVTTAIGSTAEAFSLVLQPDGKLVAAGRAFIGSWDFALVRYNSDGSLDATFGTNGIVTTDFFGSYDYAFALVRQTNNKLVAAGLSNFSGNHFALARYNSDGNLDTSFGVNGKVTTDVSTPLRSNAANAIVFQPGGKLVAAGFTCTRRGSLGLCDNDFALVRYNNNGSLDTTFGSGGKVITNLSPSNTDDNVNALILQPDGKLIAAGVRDDSRGGIDFALVRYNTNGSQDFKVITDFGGEDFANALVLQPDGRFVAAGYSLLNADSDFALARYLGDNNTYTGTNVTVSPGSGVDLTFTEITAPGNTTVAVSDTGPTPPSGFSLASRYYDIQTTATYTPPLTVCITYNPAEVGGDPNTLQLFHFENSVWADVTTSNDTVNGVVCGQVSTLSPFILAQSNRPPDVSQARPSAATLWPPNHQFVPVSILGVTDPDGDPVEIVINRISQDEPVQGLGEGDAAPDATGLGTATAQLRAERSGQDNGRVYTLIFEARDGRGGLSTGVVTVGVPHDQGKGRVPVNDGAMFDSTQ